ncbi:D-aminoacyl-tRNA deacylase-like [Mercenaria mercenaria]|uniref:D-aminoacyl-tRNA deacylase-like n=1 Tax=Mercenaria mercenaria TaxID=6596 RepID=UPI00234EF601|nr:D-aminoacyl-tRNA deacylase-like [Mercenaria mercenaria]
MKAIVQRVARASVTVDGKVISSIGNGLCVLVGVGRKDAPKEAEWLAQKILKLRLFDDDSGKRWNKNVMEKQFEVLCVSQFTLYVQMKGNKPDFHDAMAPDLSEQFYGDFLKIMKKNYSADKIKDGVFGAMMVVHIENDGPVTIPLESPDNLPEPKVRKWQTNKKASQGNKGKSNTTTESSSSIAHYTTEDSSARGAENTTEDSSIPCDNTKERSDDKVEDLAVDSLTISSEGAGGDS